MKRKRGGWNARRGVACLLWLALFAACRTATDPTAEEIATHLMDPSQPPHHAIIETALEAADGTVSSSLVSEVWVAVPERVRTEVIAGPAEIEGALWLRSGDELWEYNPRTNTYQRATVLEGMRMPTPMERATQVTQLVERIVATMDFSYLGQEEVAGRPTHKVRATPRPNEPPFLPGLSEAVLWVDSQTWQILRQEIELGAEGRWLMHYREITYDPTFPHDLFTFVPPPGAQEVAPTVSRMPRGMLLEEARRQVDFTVLTPTWLPPGMELQDAQLIRPSTDGRPTTLATWVVLSYQSGDATLSINQASPESQTQLFTIPPGARSHELSVGGQPATLTQLTSSAWALVIDGDTRQLVVEATLSEEELLRVTESLK